MNKHMGINNKGRHLLLLSLTSLTLNNRLDKGKVFSEKKPYSIPIFDFLVNIIFNFEKKLVST